MNIYEIFMIIYQFSIVIIQYLIFSTLPCHKAYTMLRKKNYKQQQHFCQLHTFSAISPAGPNYGPKKYQVYYKRYRPQEASKNIYNLIHNKGQNKQGDQEVVNAEYPVDRTLELISFDGDLGFLRKYLKKIGKVRQYQTGQGIYKGQKINTAMCVFKFQFDLVKCFRDDYLQSKMDQQSLPHSKAINQQHRQQQRFKLINEHLDKQLKDKVNKIKQMQDQGYQVVTDIYGQYRLDYQANKKFVENLPQIKKKKKREQKELRLKQLREKEKEEHMRKQNSGH